MGTLLCLGIPCPNSLPGAVSVCSKLLTRRANRIAHGHVRVIKALAVRDNISNGKLEIHNSLLNVVLYDKPQIRKSNEGNGPT